MAEIAPRSAGADGLDDRVRVDGLSAERMNLDVPASFRKNRRVFLNNEEMRLQVLVERIRQKTVNAADTQVFIRSDGGLLVQDLIDVLGELKAAGVQAAGIVTKLPGE